jgi:hypothetical protein
MKDLLITIALCIVVIILTPIAILALLGLAKLIANMYLGIVDVIKDIIDNIRADKIEKLDGKKVRIYLNCYGKKVITGVLEKHTEWDGSTCCDLGSMHNTYDVLNDKGNSVLEKDKRIHFAEIKKIEEIKI